MQTIYLQKNKCNDYTYNDYKLNVKLKFHLSSFCSECNTPVETISPCCKVPVCNDCFNVDLEKSVRCVICDETLFKYIGGIDPYQSIWYKLI